MEVSYFLCYSSLNGPLATINSAAVNIVIHIPFCIGAFISLGHFSLCRIAGSKCICIFFLMNIAKSFFHKIVSVSRVTPMCS